MIGSETPRYYEAEDGTRSPSVTTIQSVLDKPALIPWAVKMVIEDAVNKLTPRQKYGVSEIKNILQSSRYVYKQETERACDIGTTVHTLIENFLRHGSFGDIDPATAPNSQELLNCAHAFIDWMMANQVEVIALEVPIKGTGYAGRIDAVVRLNGVVTLVDFKTSKGFYDTHPMQLAAYAAAYNSDDANTEKIEACGILRLSKSGVEYEYRDFTERFHKSFAEFLSLAVFWSIHRDDNYSVAVEQSELLTRVLKVMAAGGVSPSAN